MKKFTVLALALVLTLFLAVTAHAIEINQGSSSQQADVEVTTSVGPTYTVSIPANTTVAFNATSTPFGSVKLESARLTPGYAVQVGLNASGALKNKVDAGRTIAYAIMAGSEAFTAAQYTSAGQETKLTIDITQAAWNAAAAGQYADTVTFTVSYVPVKQ